VIAFGGDRFGGERGSPHGVDRCRKKRSLQAWIR
jgi:hypothetical protein